MRRGGQIALLRFPIPNLTPEEVRPVLLIAPVSGPSMMILGELESLHPERTKA